MRNPDQKLKLTNARLAAIWLGATVFLSHVGHANAIVVVPVDPYAYLLQLSDFSAYRLERQFLDGSIFRVEESYAAQYLTTYSGNVGNAIVAQSESQPGKYFDAQLYLSDWQQFTSVTLELKVTNLTPWAWSGYHLEVQSPFGLVAQASSDAFANVSINGGQIDFAGPTELLGGHTGTFTLTLNTAFNDGYFNIRQVATTAVPEPESYATALLGTGLLAWVARRRKR